MQNKKELIRLRRFMPAARTTRARSAQFGFGLIKGQFFKYRKEKRKEKSLRGRGGGLRRSGGAPGADLACKRHRHVQSWLLESPNFL